MQELKLWITEQLNLAKKVIASAQQNDNKEIYLKGVAERDILDSILKKIEELEKK